MDITVFLMYKKDISEIKEAIQGAKNVIVITEQGSASALAGDTYKKFDEMINFLREDDELIVCEFSRLFVPLPITAKLTYHYQRYFANGLSCRQAVRGHCPISCSMRNASPLSFFCSSHSKSR